MAEALKAETVSIVALKTNRMSEDHKKLLEQQLWNIANTLRGKMNADEFRVYILGFIFYKYLSERMHLYANKILKQDGITYEQIEEKTEQGQAMLEAIREESIEQLGYFLKPSELFHTIASRGNGNGKRGESPFILDDLSRILNNIEQSTMGTESEDDFDHLFEDLDLTSTKLGRTESAKNELISKVLSHLDKIDFQLENTELDVLGDAYEYLIAQFASSAGKKAGEFYTPQEVSKVLAKLVTTGKTKLRSAYDPTCGSGSLLLRIAREVKSVSSFYGQEQNPTTYNLARMNMILHGVHYRKFDIQQEDTLERPQHLDLRFEAIVANPPFSAKWSANPIHLSDDRFSQYGKLAPASKADFAFVQHMIYHLDENGQMAVVLPHGVLYRGNTEAHIRQYLIEDRNYLDAVIGLPANIFYGTSIPTCILVFKKCREHPDDILFIDASGDDHYEKGKNQNHLRDGDVDRIITTYRQRKTQDKYSYVAPLEEVRENDYNLNIPRYVDIFEEEELIDLPTVAENLLMLDRVSKDNDIEITKHCEELGVPKPLGNNLYLLQQYKKGLMQQIFSCQIRFRDDKGNNYSDWSEKEFGNIFNFYRTNSFSRNQLNYESGKVKNIHYGDIHTKFRSNFDVSKEDVPFVDEGISLNKVPESSYCKEGDLIIADASEDYQDIGKAIEIINLDGQKVLAGLHTMLARDIKGQTVIGFKGYMMQASYVRLQIMKAAAGISVLGISKKNLSKVRVSLPSPPEQRKITDFLSALDRKIDFLNEQLKLTTNQE